MSKNNINVTNKKINNEIMNKVTKEIVNPKGKNVDIYLMEKDKEIIDLITLNKSLLSQIEDLKRANKEKEIQIVSLKADINTYETDKKLSMKEIEKLNEDIKNLNNLLHIKENEINELMKKNDDTVKEISNAYNTQIQNYEDTLRNTQNIQMNNNTLTEKMLLKDKEIINMQKIIYELKQDIKKNFNLEKEIQEQKLTICQLKEYIKKLEKENFIYGNNYDTLSNTNNDKQSYNYEYSNNIKDNQQNMNTNTNLSSNKDIKAMNDYNNYVNNNLISFIIEQIKKVELSIDNKDIMNVKNNIYNDVILNEENTTYELIKQNFNLLINKIKYMHEDNFKKKSELLKLIDIEKNKNKQNSQKEILSLRQALDMKTVEAKQLSEKLNKVISSHNSNNNNLINIFEKRYNEIFAKLKNFTQFYCGGAPGNNTAGPINLKMPNFSLSDNIDKKINDIFYTLQNIINYIENNMKNNKGINNNNIKKNFDNYMKEINDLNIKIKKLSELFNKNENLLKQITDENTELKQRNIQLEKIIESMNGDINNENNNDINNNNTINNLWKISGGVNSNNCNSTNSNNKEKKSMLELKDLISLQQTKNDNLMNEFYNKDQQITNLENEANKLIQENYAGNNINIINNSKNNNLNNNNINFNNNINNQMYTFKNENEDNNYGDENYVQEETGDDVCNDMNMNNNDDNDCPPCHDDNDNDMDYNDMYDENCDDGNEYNEEDDNYYNEEIINDNDDNNY